MIVKPGSKYLFMTQRYAWSGTVIAEGPTHCHLGPDARVHYQDIGPFEKWADGSVGPGGVGPGGAVPGQVVSLLGTDCTPMPMGDRKILTEEVLLGFEAIRRRAEGQILTAQEERCAATARAYLTSELKFLEINYDDAVRALKPLDLKA